MDLLRLLLLRATLNILFVALSSCEDNYTSENEVELLESAGFPNLGDIPVLNRKIFKGQRVTIREHPYVVSIRRNFVHYLTGALLTRNVVLTIAHAVLDVPVYELGVVVGENYADRGSIINTVVLVILHENFDRFTLQYDIAMLRLFENISYRGSVKSITLISPTTTLNGAKAFVTGWGRCDNTGSELCLPRSSRYYPDEKIDTMLRSISFIIIKPNYYCEGYIRNNIKFYHGMNCLGPAREENPVCPCMAVPGAPLVINAKLAALSSWGFGCGYVYDLPLVYTDITAHNPWILENIIIQKNIKQNNLSSLFKATKAYEIIQWINATRIIKSNFTLKSDKYIEPLEIDKLLALVPGIVYDIRDYINAGVYRIFKTDLYDEFKLANIRMQQVQKQKQAPYKSFSFLRKEVLDEKKNNRYGKDLKNSFQYV